MACKSKNAVQAYASRRKISLMGLLARRVFAASAALSLAASRGFLSPARGREDLLAWLRDNRDVDGMRLN
jgi:hypothetical protein